MPQRHLPTPARCPSDHWWPRRRPSFPVNHGATGTSSAASTTAGATDTADESDTSASPTAQPTTAADPLASSSASSFGQYFKQLDTATTATTAGATSDSDSDGTHRRGRRRQPEAAPLQLAPCGPGSCWLTLTFSGICGATDVAEDFASGAFNVHRFELSVRACVPVTLTLTRTGGDFDPADRP